MRILGSASLSIIGRTLVRSLAALCLLASAADGVAVTLEDSVAATLETNPDVGVVQADREAIDQELRQARAEYLPSIDLRGAAGPEYTNSPATRNRATRPPGGDSATTLMRWESQITLSQMLFDGFATQSEVERQISRIDSAAYRVQEAAEFIALDAIEAHLEVLRNQVLVELARENVAEHERILGLVRELEGQGGELDRRRAPDRGADRRGARPRSPPRSATCATPRRCTSAWSGERRATSRIRWCPIRRCRRARRRRPPRPPSTARRC